MDAGDHAVALTAAGVIGGSLVLLTCMAFGTACCVLGKAFSPGRGCCTPHDSAAPVALLVGDSLTQGTISFHFAEELRRRFPALHVANAGVNGNPSFHILKCLPKCLQSPECSQLKVAVVLCGTNDTIAMMHPELANMLYKGKLGDAQLGAAEKSSVSIFESNLRAIVRLLLSKCASVIVVSPPVLGDVLPPAPTPLHPSYGLLSVLPNAALAEVAAVTKHVADEEGCVYVPLFEELSQRLPAALSALGRRPFEFDGRMGQIMLATPHVLAHDLLGRSWDALSTSVFTHDGIHLNERGGAILLELLVPALEQLATENSSTSKVAPQR